MAEPDSDGDVKLEWADGSGSGWIKVRELTGATETTFRDAQKTLAARPAPFASRPVRRALLMSQVNPGSLYRCGGST